MEAHQSIVNSTNLHSLLALVAYGKFPNQSQYAPGIETLSTCPNIKELDLSIVKVQQVSKGAQGQSDSFGFRSNPNATFPSLEVLKLRGYDLDSKCNIEWKEVNRQGYSDDDDDDIETSRSLWNVA